MATSDKSSHIEANSIERFGNYSWGIIKFIFQSIVFIFLGVIFSIIIEWIGMSTIWKDEGENHAANMLRAEMAYLDEDFSRFIFGVSPILLLENTIDRTEDILRADSGWRRYILNLNQPIYRSDGTVAEYSKRFVRHMSPYFSAAHDIIVLYVVRMVIVFLSLPLIALVAFAWFIDGLCQRELRKDGGGRESTTKFHFVSKYIAIALLTPFVFYMASPVATHPNWVLAPIALTVGFLTYYAASNYKKYL